MSGRIRIIKPPDSSPVSTGLAPNSGFDVKVLDLCSFARRSIEELLHPESHLRCVEKGQFPNLEMNGQDFLHLVLFNRIEDCLHNIGSDREFVHPKENVKCQRPIVK